MSAPDATHDVPFQEAWQAQVYGLAHALSEAGLFTWTEWTQMLGAKLREHPDDDGSHYYDAWLAALEAMAIAKGAADPSTLARLKAAWSQAYETTPHGKPVALAPWAW